MGSSKTSGKLHCAACGRSAGTGPNDVETVAFLEQEWCERCARVERMPNGFVVVSQPSPGRMIEGLADDPLEAWWDCYKTTPKRRIRVREAESEIQRAWAMWEGDKTGIASKLIFFGWLTRFRPYFLTFRCRGDPWQTVHAWLLQYERTTSHGH